MNYQTHDPHLRPHHYTPGAHLRKIVDSFLFLATLFQIGYLVYHSYHAMHAPINYHITYLHPELQNNLPTGQELEFGLLSPSFSANFNLTAFQSAGCKKYNIFAQPKTQPLGNSSQAFNSASWCDVSLTIFNSMQASEFIDLQTQRCLPKIKEQGPFDTSQQDRRNVLIFQLYALVSLTSTSLLLYNNRDRIHLNRILTYHFLKYFTYWYFDFATMFNTRYFSAYGETCILNSPVFNTGIVVNWFYLTITANIICLSFGLFVFYAESTLYRDGFEVCPFLFLVIYGYFATMALIFCIFSSDGSSVSLFIVIKFAVMCLGLCLTEFCTSSLRNLCQAVINHRNNWLEYVRERRQSEILRGQSAAVIDPNPENISSPRNQMDNLNNQIQESQEAL